jgi:hypothetical protein
MFVAQLYALHRPIAATSGLPARHSGSHVTMAAQPGSQVRPEDGCSWWDCDRQRRRRRRRRRRRPRAARPARGAPPPAGRRAAPPHHAAPSSHAPPPPAPHTSPQAGGRSHTEAAIAHLRTELAGALEAARAACAVDSRSRACAAAYDAVDEISAALARKKERLAEELGGGGGGEDPYSASNPWARGGGGGAAAGGGGLYPQRPPAQR